MFGRTRSGQEIAAGGRLGPYKLEAELGQGGMGIVFRARDERSEEMVALKVMRREYSGDATYRRRFEHEARAARAANNRHLVGVLEVGEADGFQYLALTYVSGRSLEARLAEGPLGVDELLRLAAEVGSGLDALHSVGVIHRDVKPTNVLLDEQGVASLTDFGLAKGRDYTVLTKMGQVMGTLDYLAPELIRGQPAGPPSDIYAIGCVIFECIAGQPPFGGKSVFEVGMAHLQEEPPDPCVGRADLPPALSWAILQALAKDPARRPPSATAFANMLRVAATGAGAS